jgi:hypothetical protein
MQRASMRLAAAAVVVLGIVAAQRATVLSQVPPGGAPFGGKISNGVGGAGAAPASSVVQGFTEIVTISKAGDTVWLYSLHTGKWHKQTIPADQGRPKPTVGFGLVAFRTRTMVFACSSQTGAWDSVDVGDLPAQPTVGKNMATFRAGNKLYGFSAETGAWDAIEVGEGEAGHPTLGAFAILETGSKVYAFSPRTGTWAVVDRAARESGE